jgi:hypothetical protein
MTHALEILAASVPGWGTAGRLLTAVRVTLQCWVRLRVRPSHGRVSEAWLNEHEITAGKHQDQ